MNNLAAVLYGIQDIRVEEAPLPGKPGANDLLLKVHSVGICGTDNHFFGHGSLGQFLINSPQILGHEVSAVVVEVGSDVKDYVAGDHVTLEPALPCTQCTACRVGQNNLCPYSNEKCLGAPPYQGAMQRYFIHPAAFCHKLPAYMALEDGALVEPLACVVHAVQRAGVKVGQNVLVCGAGAIGLLTLCTVKAFGAKSACITDINEMKLKIAASTGCADQTYLVDPKKSPKDGALEVVKKMGIEPDVVLDCSGYESSVQLSIYAAKAGSKVALVGLGSEDVKIPLIISSLKELDLIGCCRFNNTFPLAIHLLASGKIPTKSIITNKFKLEDAKQAFEVMRTGKGCKVLIQP